MWSESTWGHLLTKGRVMRKIPKPPIEPTDALADRLLREFEAGIPKMLLLFRQEAQMRRWKHAEFVKAGFTDEQAFELCKK